MPYRQVLQGLLKRTRNDTRRARLLAELHGPPFPSALGYLWKIFGRLSARRGGNGFGPLPVGWLDIEAFCRLARVSLSPWEIEVLEDLDREFLTPPVPPKQES